MVAVLGGCANDYKIPVGAETATVKVQRGTTPEVFGQNAYFVAYEDSSCRKLLGSLGDATVFTPNPGPRPIAANSTIFVKAFSNAPAGGPIQVCVNVIQFSPRAGSAYTFSHQMTRGACSLQVASTPYEGREVATPIAVSPGCR